MFNDLNDKSRPLAGQGDAPGQNNSMSPDSLSASSFKKPVQPKQFFSKQEQATDKIGQNQQNAEDKPIEDIFSSTDSNNAADSSSEGKPEVFQPKESQAGISGDVSNKDISGHKAQKIFILIVLVLGIVVVGVGGVFAYRAFFSNASNIFESKQNQEINLPEESEKNILEDSKQIQNQEAKIIPPESDTGSEASTSKAPPLSKDSDSDGLTDKEEQKLGTDINSNDSDNDGLFDREEVNVYKTDPLNPDTDGDGFLDGEEVKKGYNPAGKGKLYKTN